MTCKYVLALDSAGRGVTGQRSWIVEGCLDIVYSQAQRLPADRVEVRQSDERVVGYIVSVGTGSYDFSTKLVLHVLPFSEYVERARKRVRRRVRGCEYEEPRELITLGCTCKSAGALTTFVQAALRLGAYLRPMPSYLLSLPCNEDQEHVNVSKLSDVLRILMTSFPSPI